MSATIAVTWKRERGGGVSGMRGVREEGEV